MVHHALGLHVVLNKVVLDSCLQSAPCTRSRHSCCVSRHTGARWGTANLLWHLRHTALCKTRIAHEQ